MHPDPPQEIITSRQNHWFRRFRQAIEEHDDEIVIEGPKQLTDALLAGWAPVAVAVTARTIEGVAAAPRVVFGPRLMKALSDTVHSQGVLGLFERPEDKAEIIFQGADRSVIVALEGVQDPGNVGTIVRLAAAFETAGIVLLDGCADPFSQKSIRASAGTVLQIPIARMGLVEFLESVHSRQLQLHAAVAGPLEARTPPTARSGIVFGSEGHGISAEILSEATPISIAMSPSVESLNVAAAAAILLHRSFEARHTTKSKRGEKTP